MELRQSQNPQREIDEHVQCLVPFDDIVLVEIVVPFERIVVGDNHSDIDLIIDIGQLQLNQCA